ncbi:MAG TPA: zinc transporter ZupT [Spirochaetales bacterium]|nr:zinc transporter ZupT [Spirochaetales bacterium]
MITANELSAFGLTVFAGLATGIGSVIALSTRKPSARFLSISLGFSAGVMIYVSLVEILQKARIPLMEAFGERGGSWAAVAGFFGGVAVIAIIDKLIPESINPHEAHTKEEVAAHETVPPGTGTLRHKDQKRLLRMGMFTALAVGIHNFPEGLATFLAALQEPSLGVAIAFAIAIHNIPEGISVAVPVFYATNSRAKAFWYSFASGLAEPAGVLIGYTILKPFVNDVVFGVLFASVAGIMVYISVDELLPAAREYGEHHLAIGGLFAGMAVMAVSLILFM